MPRSKSRNNYTSRESTSKLRQNCTSKRQSEQVLSQDEAHAPNKITKLNLFLQKKREINLLNKYNKDRLYLIIEHVMKLWEDATPPYPYTLHNECHCAGVEEQLYLLFGKKNLKDYLNQSEIFHLLASIWLHDIGMIPTLETNTNPSPILSRNKDATIKAHDEVRKNHAINSKKYIFEKFTILKLSKSERDNICKMVEYHRFKAYKILHELEDCTNNESNHEDPVRIQLLTAYLRLADNLQIPFVGSDVTFRIYMALGLDAGARFHWFKSKYTDSISFSPEYYKITIKFKIPPMRPEDKQDWKDKIKPLKEAIRKNVQDELDAVKEILSKGKYPVYLYIDCDTKIQENMPAPDVIELNELCNNIDLFDPANTPNAGSVSDTVIRQIDLYLTYNNENIDLTYLNDYKENILDKLLPQRPYHIVLHNISEMLNNVLNGKIRYFDLVQIKEYIQNDIINLKVEEQNTVSKINKNNERHKFILDLLQRYETGHLNPQEKENIEKYVRIYIYIRELKNRKKKDIKIIPEMAYGLLADGLPVLLYGYSGTVVRCFEYYLKNRKKNIDVYICEGRTKTKYRYNNRLVYSDGLIYAAELKKVEEKVANGKTININYITDSCPSHLFVDNKVTKVTKVFIGANGINLNGDIAHSLGHLALADMAKEHNIPVYVIAESMKIGDFNKYNQKEGATNDDSKGRDNLWLTTDIEFEHQFLYLKYYNPRNDIIPADKIHGIVTEKGIIQPDKIENHYGDISRALLEDHRDHPINLPK